MTKQPFTHKPTLPRDPKVKEKRELHGEKVKPQRELAKRNNSLTALGAAETLKEAMLRACDA